METELPELFRRRERQARRAVHVPLLPAAHDRGDPEALAAMNTGGEGAATELADAGCDAVAYACLVAVMVAGPGAHVDIEARLGRAAAAPVVTSAGALPDAIRAVGATPGRTDRPLPAGAHRAGRRLPRPISASRWSTRSASGSPTTAKSAGRTLDASSTSPTGSTGAMPRPSCSRRAFRCRRCL